MPILKGRKKVLMTYLLIGYFILTAIFLGLFFYKTNLMNSLDEQTYEKINHCMSENSYTVYGEEQLKEILSEYKSQQSKIEKNTLVNSITGVLITVGITIATINKIIKDTKNIWMEFNHEFKKKESGCSYEEIYDMMEHIYEIKETENKDGKLEKMMTLLMEQFSQVLNQTVQFTNQINHDRDLLTTGIEEMRAGMEQIGQVMISTVSKGNDGRKEEVGATMQQMNSAIEEMNMLLMDMEKKIQYLSNNMKKYSIKNKS
ncbi:hypothetical protein [Inediibacterium massiliense]|uniref:hypothetical protein n=1 Tax=Inediibacterium massiliense TaxID=1658111 RepID=UPI0006B664FF|nr:hypothetical protein [Inediibacterium massiliense]